MMEGTLTSAKRPGDDVCAFSKGSLSVVILDSTVF